MRGISSEAVLQQLDGPMPCMQEKELRGIEVLPHPPPPAPSVGCVSIATACRAAVGSC